MPASRYESEYAYDTASEPPTRKRTVVSRLVVMRVIVCGPEVAICAVDGSVSPHPQTQTSRNSEQKLQRTVCDRRLRLVVRASVPRRDPRALPRARRGLAALGRGRVRGRGLAGGRAAAALVHVVPDVREFAGGVVDVVLRLVERAEHARGGVDERVGVPLVVRELSGANGRPSAAVLVPPEDGGYDRDRWYVHPRRRHRRGP